MCGPGDAADDGLTGTLGDTTVSYGRFTSSPNNDCSVPGSPTSLTVDGVQLGSVNPMYITFCLPRPEALGRGLVPLGDADRVQLIDIFVERADGCVLALDRTHEVAGTTHEVAGTMEVLGYCGQGLDPSGYALVLEASVPMRDTCTNEPVAEPLVLSGAVAVTAL